MHGLHQNYDPYYTLHYSVSFIVKLNGNKKHVTYICVMLKWYKFKKPKALFSESIKNKTFLRSLSCAYQPLLKILVTLNFQIEINFATTTTPPLRQVARQVC